MNKEITINKGIIYFIQPCELVGTNRYKIGCSKQNNLDRCYKGYKKGSRYICIMECIDALLLEKKIKDIFNYKFKLIGGNEYFEGDENDMINEFLIKVNEHKLNTNINTNTNTNTNNTNNNNTNTNNNTNNNTDTNINNTNINNTNINNTNINNTNINNTNTNINNKNTNINNTNINLDLNLDLIKVFSNYKDDESFGGTKQLLKIKIENHNIIALCINDKKLIETNICYTNNDFFTKYYENIIKNNIIENNYIYDLNDCEFIKKLDKYKEKININYCDKIELLFLQFKNIKFDSYLKVNHYLANNAILNEIIYCDINNLNINDLDIYINFTIKGKVNIIKAIKINNKYYDYKYIRKYTPYCIQLNKNTNEFYFMNRDYEFIGLNTKISPFTNKKNNYEKLYLFNDNCPPWFNDDDTTEKINDNLKNIIIKYTKFNLNYKCLNTQIQTKNIMELK